MMPMAASSTVLAMEFDRFSALIVVDVQNDFARPTGNLYVSGGENVIEFINAQIEMAAGAGATVVYTQDWHPESTPHFQTEGGIWPVHCVKGTSGAELHSDLDVVGDAIRIRKGAGGEDGYSGFTMRDPIDGSETSTGLAEQLKERGVKNVAVLGLALDYCVKETALDAVQKGFETVLLADGTRPVNLSTGDGARAVAELVGAGVEIE